VASTVELVKEATCRMQTRRRTGRRWCMAISILTKLLDRSIYVTTRFRTLHEVGQPSHVYIARLPTQIISNRNIDLPFIFSH
jgi:hypothetical protein